MGNSISDRYFAHPWLVGQNFCFKPLPTFEFGFTHVIMFGGRHNDFYSPSGFFGRATAFSTGSPSVGNTKSRAGIYLKFYFPETEKCRAISGNCITGQPYHGGPPDWRGPPVPFGFLPGWSLPAASDRRWPHRPAFQNTLLSNRTIAAHGDSLYYTYNGWLFGDGLGPNSTEVDLQIGRWFRGLTKASVDVFYTERAPNWGTNTQYPTAIYGPVTKEHSGGVAFDLLRVPQTTQWISNMLVDGRARVAFEYVDHMNYGGPGNFRVLVMLSTSLAPTWPSLAWR